MSYTDSLNVLMVVNGIGMIGRLTPNFFADRVGTITLYAPCALAAGVCVLCWTAVDSPMGLYVWSALYGIAAGGMQSLFPAGLASLTDDPKKVGVRMGMVFTTNSFATLTGPPIAGVIISNTPGGKYYGAQIFAGCVLLLGFIFMAAARIVKTRKIGKGWKVKV